MATSIILSSEAWIVDEAMKRYIILHHVHDGSHLAYFCLNYIFNGSTWELKDGTQTIMIYYSKVCFSAWQGSPLVYGSGYFFM